MSTLFYMLLVVILSLFLTSGCSPRVQVEDIVAGPSKYVGRGITVPEGSTRDAFWLPDLGKGAYRLRGKTGVTIWVITTNTPPQQFEVVRIRGVVADNFTLGDRFFEPVILERSRRLIYHYPGVGPK